MIEVDFLPASQSQSGDCILLRVGSFSYDPRQRNNQIVIMIDSGFSGCSNDIRRHLTEYYRTSRIDYVFITHPDADHISGLNTLLDDTSIDIGTIVVHDPWNHVNSVFSRTQDGRRTRKSIKGKFEETLKILDQVFEKMEKRRVPTQEAFAGGFLSLGEYELTILGPSKGYYEYVLMQFPGMDNEKMTRGPSIYEEEIDWKFIDRFFLKNPDTSPKNNSSMVILISQKKSCLNGFSEMKEPLFLFTGDAGTEALWKAVSFASESKLLVKGCKYMQLPHHGSLKNVNAALLGIVNAEKYIVSASSVDLEHPSRLLVNYIRGILGKPLYHINDSTMMQFGFGGPFRPGWGCAIPKPMFSKVFKLKGGV